MPLPLQSVGRERKLEPNDLEAFEEDLESTGAPQPQEAAFWLHTWQVSRWQAPWLESRFGQ